MPARLTIFQATTRFPIAPAAGCLDVMMIQMDPDPIDSGTRSLPDYGALQVTSRLPPYTH